MWTQRQGGGRVVISSNAKGVDDNMVEKPDQLLQLSITCRAMVGMVEVRSLKEDLNWKKERRKNLGLDMISEF